MLSKEDFESIGFVHTGGKLVANIGQLYEKELRNSIIHISCTKNECLIQEVNKHKEKWDTLYEGPIKDLKELKVILKKLLI